ncbi:hypothetical protein A8924_6471 [Saccharopolyspora erythraea NRRL 2338]|uniref:Uncharacterized protein n=2 Tax=Saccharopolyspora erythraea TaxID=1836 RepID=A4FMM2_SACEN|nr:hypothetical protein [Saccharopolyspora erythraea]EQD85519.1 hypothetical protein N599_14280 [Saccharopolyspora erythraea D]PFG98945.1 hypothetical protein A8924_6471 [Saccharopolyspora erythraea NRRL 2338]QRK88927.1 hypothetical protein JQX30_30680 [Saccharopolyspora erythraea]CAM05297.1 hypothetical protein SACE_6124 [Saccharopolyspora erythraea NRRL 2338]
MGAGRNSSLQRLARRVWPGANPLRRRTDWFEPVALFVLFLAAIVVVALALLTSQSVLRDRLAAVHEEETSRHPVVATVVADLRDQGSANRSLAVRWGQPPDERFAVIHVPAHVRAEKTVPVWLDRDGQITSAPSTRAEATQAAGTIGAAVLLGGLMALSIGYGLARWLVVRGRLSAWGAEWEWVEPRWRNHMT